MHHFTRQARDKHRENSKKSGISVGECSNSARGHHTPHNSGGGRETAATCLNLAVWWPGNSSPSDEFSTGQIAGNPDGVFSWDVSGRTDMKALCIEIDLKPENLGASHCELHNK